MKHLPAQEADSPLFLGETVTGGMIGLVNWLWYFWFYSFLGWGLERAFALLSRAESQKRRCFLLLPLCPVYGFGMLAVLALPPMGWFPLAVWGGLAATAVEYAYHWVGEVLLGVWFWDYSQVPGNVAGRVCLPFSLAWGVLTAGAVHFVQPLAAVFAEAIPAWGSYAFLLLFTADTVCSLYFLRVTGDLEGMRQAVPVRTLLQLFHIP